MALEGVEDIERPGTIELVLQAHAQLVELFYVLTEKKKRSPPTNWTTRAITGRATRMAEGPRSSATTTRLVSPTDRGIRVILVEAAAKQNLIAMDGNGYLYCFAAN
jgi:hypothetical protein